MQLEVYPNDSVGRVTSYCSTYIRRFITICEMLLNRAFSCTNWTDYSRSLVLIILKC